MATRSQFVGAATWTIEKERAKVLPVARRVAKAKGAKAQLRLMPELEAACRFGTNGKTGRPYYTLPGGGFADDATEACHEWVKAAWLERETP